MDPTLSGKTSSRQPKPCPECADTGYRIIQQDGVDVAQRCSCRQRDLIRRRLLGSGIPERYRHCDLDGFLTQNPSLLQALEQTRRLVHTGPGSDAGLIFCGPCGVGKTHLAVAALRAMVERYGVRGLFFEFGTLLRRIQDTYDRRSETPSWAVIGPTIEADLLVLDDLGATRSTPWVLDTLGLIVGERYNRNRMTLFTTNRPEHSPKGQSETLADRVGERLASRLAEMCRTVVMDGPDFRKSIRAAAHRI